MAALDQATIEALRRLAAIPTPSGFMADFGTTLAANGYHIIPIAPRKKFPGILLGGRWELMSEWQKYSDRMPTDMELECWSQWPGCGIGLACGNVIGIDIDVLDAAVAMELETLARKMLGDSPALRIGRFPKRALFYRAATPFPGRKMHPLEVYGLNSQMVIAGIHPVTGEPYTWPNESLVELDISQLPVVTETQTMAWLAEAFKRVPAALLPNRLGNGDATLATDRVSGDPRGTREAIKSALTYLPNADLDGTSWIGMCNAIKAACGDEGRDLWLDWSTSSAKSGASGKSDTAAKRWASAKPRNIGAGSIYYRAQQRGWVPPSDLILNGDAAELAAQPHRAAALIANGGAARVNASAAEPVTATTETAKPGKLKLIWASEIKPRLFAGGTLVKGLLDRGAMSVVYAPSNAGKSFFCLDLALHVAMGWPWRNRKIKARGTVLYIAAEGGMGFYNRVAALKQHYGIREDDFCPLAVVASPIDLLDAKAHLPEILALIQEAETATGLPVALVIVDTLSRAMAGGDENSPKDMTAFVANVDAIRQAEPSPHLMVVHHAGKDVARGARGHSSLRAATDTEIEIAKDKPDDSADKAASAVIKKQRDMPGADVFDFTLKTVHLGEDEDGDAVTSAVVEHLSDSPADGKPQERESNQDAGLRVLRNVIRATGRTVNEPGNVPPATPVALVAAWRDALNEEKVIDAPKADARRKQFTRIRDALTEHGLVQTWEDFVWIGEPG